MGKKSKFFFLSFWIARQNLTVFVKQTVFLSTNFRSSNLVHRDRFKFHQNPVELANFPTKTYFVTDYIASSCDEALRHERQLEQVVAECRRAAAVDLSTQFVESDTTTLSSNDTCQLARARAAPMTDDKSKSKTNSKMIKVKLLS